VCKINLSKDKEYQHQYKVTLRYKDGGTYSSKWMGENSLSKTKKI
jgi:hypothetical protein